MANPSPIRGIDDARSAPPLAPLSPGIPTYTMRHGCAEWKPRHSAFMLYNDWDVFWVRRGVLSFELKDGPKLQVGPDEFALLPPYVPAMLRCGAGGLTVGFCHFAFRLAPTGVAEPVERDAVGPADKAMLPLHFSAADAPGVRDAYAALLAVGAPEPGQPWRIERALIALVAELADHGVRHARSGAQGRTLPARRLDPRLEGVRARIAGEPSRAWRVSALAREAGLSASRLHRLHTDFYGTSLKHHIIESRLRQALPLLRADTDGRRRPVHEVAAACGFSSQAFFSRQFKAVFHVSPTDFQRNDLLA